MADLSLLPSASVAAPTAAVSTVFVSWQKEVAAQSQPVPRTFTTYDWHSVMLVPTEHQQLCRMICQSLRTHQRDRSEQMREHELFLPDFATIARQLSLVCIASGL